MNTLHPPPNFIPMKEKYIYETAVQNGCNPRWYDGIFGWAWHCTCTDLQHACDQQCSAISEESAQR